MYQREEEDFSLGRRKMSTPRGAELGNNGPKQYTVQYYMVLVHSDGGSPL